jgi:hypothetical protein
VAFVCRATGGTWRITVQMNTHSRPIEEVG